MAVTRAANLIRIPERPGVQRPAPPPTVPGSQGKPWKLGQSARGVKYALDTDRDGKVTKAEIRQHATLVPAGPGSDMMVYRNDAEAFFNAANTKSDGKLTQGEILKFLKGKFDYNGNNSLDRRETGALAAAYGALIAGAASNDFPPVISDPIPLPEITPDHGLTPLPEPGVPTKDGSPL
jgi:hypothetical protein